MDLQKKLFAYSSTRLPEEEKGGNMSTVAKPHTENTLLGTK